MPEAGALVAKDLFCPGALVPAQDCQTARLGHKDRVHWPTYCKLKAQLKLPQDHAPCDICHVPAKTLFARMRRTRLGTCFTGMAEAKPLLKRSLCFLLAKYQLHGRLPPLRKCSVRAITKPLPLNYLNRLLPNSRACGMIPASSIGVPGSTSRCYEVCHWASSLFLHPKLQKSSKRVFRTAPRMGSLLLSKQMQQDATRRVTNLLMWLGAGHSSHRCLCVQTPAA